MYANVFYLLNSCLFFSGNLERVTDGEDVWILCYVFLFVLLCVLDVDWFIYGLLFICLADGGGRLKHVRGSEGFSRSAKKGSPMTQSSVFQSRKRLFLRELFRKRGDPPQEPSLECCFQVWLDTNLKTCIIIIIISMI